MDRDVLERMPKYVSLLVSWYSEKERKSELNGRSRNESSSY
ncbi:MAG: hypothetical protein QXU74_00650 [Candidatus Aenigmatarchaeota archaeon]